jgi:hypothetical protein
LYCKTLLYRMKYETGFLYNIRNKNNMLCLVTATSGEFKLVESVSENDLASFAAL